MSKPLTLSVRESLNPIWDIVGADIKEHFKAAGVPPRTFYRRLTKSIADLTGREMEAIEAGTGIPRACYTPDMVFFRLETGEIAAARVVAVSRKEADHE